MQSHFVQATQRPRQNDVLENGTYESRLSSLKLTRMHELATSQDTMQNADPARPLLVLRLDGQGAAARRTGTVIRDEQ